MHDLTDQFRQAFRQHPSGVAILTAPGPVALTVSSLISVSDAPATVAVSLSRRSASAAALLASDTVVIHLLQHKDRDLAQLCATPGADRFADPACFTRLATGEPRFLGPRSWFRARIVGRLPLPAATVIAAELLEGEVGAEIGADDLSMVWLNRRWHGLGPDAD